MDDNPSMSEGLRYYMDENNMNCVFAVNSKLLFLEELDKHLVDVVLVDVIMPDVIGLELFETLNEKHPFTPVIVYSNVRNIQLINDLFRINNVHALVPKNAPLERLNTVIDDVVNHKKKVLPDEFLNLNQQEITLKLTDREIQVLKLLAKGHSSKVIGEELDISENTVLFHKKKLFATFNTSNIYHLIVEAKECGFLN